MPVHAQNFPLVRSLGGSIGEFAGLLLNESSLNVNLGLLTVTVTELFKWEVAIVVYEARLLFFAVFCVYVMR